MWLTGDVVSHASGAGWAGAGNKQVLTSTYVVMVHAMTLSVLVPQNSSPCSCIALSMRLRCIILFLVIYLHEICTEDLVSY